MEHGLQLLLKQWLEIPSDSRSSFDDFSTEWLAQFNEFHLILSLSNGVIICKSAGSALQDLFTHLNENAVFVEGYPSTVRPIHHDLLRPGFESNLAIYRLARYWLGHRYREIEWLFIPIQTSDGDTHLLGGAVPLSAYVDPKDSLDMTRSGTERLIEQAYTPRGTCHPTLSFKPLTWSYLTASRTLLSLDGRVLPPEKQGIGGHAASKAREASRPSVLVVGEFSDHEAVLATMSRHYRLRKAKNISDAEDVMRSDRIDVVIAENQLPDGNGSQLIHFGSPHNDRFGGGILVYDWEEHWDDIKEEGPTGLIFSLIRPVGEYALRRAVEEIAIHIRQTVESRPHSPVN